MSTTFGEQYLENKSHLASWHGEPVFGSIRLAFSAPTELVVDCSFGRADPPQGVAVRLRGRKGRIAGVDAERFVLWDHSPFPVAVEMRASRRPFEVGVWNVWADARGTTNAWVGNAGMRVEEHDARHIRLAGNAGPNPVTFEDLRIDVSWPADVTVTLVNPG
jgi:hypothetical protein